MAPLVPITIAFALGILAATCAAGLPPWLPMSAGTAGALLGMARRHRFAMGGILLLWLSLGALRTVVWQHHPDHGLLAMLPEAPQAVGLHGVVASDPVGLFEPLDQANAGRLTVVLRLLHVRREAQWQALDGRVRATLERNVPIAHGDEVLLEGVWSRVPAPGNPGQYDFRAAMARERIHGLVRVKPYEPCVVLQPHQQPIFPTMVQGFKSSWISLIRTHASARNGGLLLSLLLGQRAALDDGLKQAFMETGTIHLLVISGFNVGLVALLLEIAGRWLGIGWRLRLLATAIGLAGYCLLTGAQPPVVRATLMAWMALGAMALDRVLSWPNTLAAAALAMLWLNPTQLFDPGFQLSFGAVASLIALSSQWAGALDRRVMWWMRPAWLRKSMAVSLAATAAIWVGLAPVLAWYFHLISPVSMLANLIVGPLVSLLVLLGTILLTLGSFAEPVMATGVHLLEWLVEATCMAVQACHRVPSGFWYVPAPSGAWLMVYYGLLGATLMWHRSVPWRMLLLIWIAGAACWGGSAWYGRHRAGAQLILHVLDVGHGDAIVIQAPNGRVLLVDAGAEEAGRFRVTPFLRSRGMGTIDGLVLTHPDGDHVGGAIPLLQQIRVGQLLTNGAQDATMTFRLVRALAARRQVPEAVIAAGDRIALDPRITIQVLHPPKQLVPGAAPVSNDNSVVLQLAMGEVRVLLTGDIEETGLPWLLAHPGLASTVLKVPHHGSRLGEAGVRLLEASRPSLAIISVGRLHRLPAAETLADLRAAGVTVCSTRDDGAVTLRTDGRQLHVATHKSQRRFTITP